MESRTISVTLECAGNNRIFLEPKVKGCSGDLVLSATPLERCPAFRSPQLAQKKFTRDGNHLEGIDAGPVEKTPRPAGDVHFARSMPLAKAMDDVLLAYEMNGERLTAAHGFPCGRSCRVGTRWPR